MQNRSDDFSYLDILASTGFAKHIGGRQATNIFIENARITKDSRVLDVGCGTGKTACRIASEVGCNVTGVDIMPRMVLAARERAKKTGVTDKTIFFEGDAKRLPLRSESFDAVIVESVTIFMDEVEQAMDEYRRVVRKGGIVCDNEVCVTDESMASLKDKQSDLEDIYIALGSRPKSGIPTFEGWKRRFSERFDSVEASHHILDPAVEMATRGEEGWTGVMSLVKTVWLYSTNDKARDIIDRSKKMSMFKDHFGYGLFVCTK